MRDFSSITIKALAAKGVTIIGLTIIPGGGEMPFANGIRGYRVDDNGTSKILTWSQVVAIVA